jgi:hypothetical protein
MQSLVRKSPFSGSFLLDLGIIGVYAQMNVLFILLLQLDWGLTSTPDALPLYKVCPAAGKKVGTMTTVALKDEEATTPSSKSFRGHVMTSNTHE